MFRKFDRSNPVAFVLMTVMIVGLTWVQLRNGTERPPLHLVLLLGGCVVGLGLVSIIAMAAWMRPKLRSSDDDPGWRPGDGPVIDGEILDDDGRPK